MRRLGLTAVPGGLTVWIRVSVSTRLTGDAQVWVSVALSLSGKMLVEW